MNTKVNMSFSIDIEDVYSELSYNDQQEFILSHIDDLGDLRDVADKCFDDMDISEFLIGNIDKLTDEQLIEEIKERGLEVSL